jgi:phosphoribosylanthranilate isomerase
LTTKIKICGITREADAQAVLSAGADALGLMFVAASPRFVSLDIACSIARQTAGALQRVGVFADSEPQQVEQVLSRVELDVLQFHGSESRAECERWGLPYIKAIRVRGPLSGELLEAAHPQACCLLLDAYRPGVLGGTGERFDLSLWPDNPGLRLALAGGLNPGNVAHAIAQVRPFAVDVSGGVEGPTRGIKDPELINEFVHAVRQVG